MLNKVSARLLKAFDPPLGEGVHKRPLDLVYEQPNETQEAPDATADSPGNSEGTSVPRDSEGVIDRGYKPPPKIKPPRRTNNNVTDTNAYYADYMAERRSNGEDL